ncbi:DUF2207 domain-containing protein [Ligilactobacillus sp. WILCCON 0076]|uniref:DUF2207 domain-containing protein n=1 Tax=Ligilactobacillus ubinensis TaxID=2876789 RepID=A0A9X2FLH4_9LACO|nr:DUF2207 domain-containing protein [Ligilactobacillus ubinensis]MCP0887424.1 DUF2207 domain-containing protein [Ligilactobacillus ubinensis]
MKKLVRSLLLIIAMVLCYLFIGETSAHAVSYDITNYSVNINVHSDGSANIVQAITYDFDGTAHGVFYTQALRNNQQTLTDPKVYLNSKNSLVEAVPSTSQAKNTYTLNKKNNDYTFKVYHPVNSSTLTVTYSYKLSQVVKNYADTADLNWKIIGSNWDTALHNVHIAIQLPEKNVSSLQAWSHGSLNGTTKVNRKSGQVILKLKRNPANTYVEAHLLFAKSVTSQNTYVSSKKHKVQAQKKEAALAKKAIAEKNENKLLSKIIGTILFISGLFLALLVLFRNARKPYNTLFPFSLHKAPHSFEMPPFSAPIAQVLCFNRYPDNQAFSAYLLELAAQKRIAITQLEPKKSIRKPNHPDYQITLLDKSLLVGKDNQFLKLLFSTGTNDSFTFSKLKKVSNRTSEKLEAAFSSWTKAQYDAAQKLHYLNSSVSSIKGSLIASFIFATIFMLGGAFLVKLLWLNILSGLFILGFLIAYFYLWRTRSPFTVGGVTKINDIRGFYTMLDDIGRFNLRELNDRILWEDIMPYAVAFGLASKVVKALATTFSKDELQTNFGFYYLLTYNQAFYFDSSFTTNFQGSIASVSGGSGGFSGGSSGGFGGGSGGGAF